MRILLTRLSALGDIIHAWPMVVTLRQSLPDTEVAWLVEEPFLPLVSGHPEVAAAIPVATRRWRHAPLSATTRDEIGLARAAIADFAPEVAIDPQGLVKSAVWARLAGVPRRIGFAGRARREWLAGACYTEVVTPPLSARHVVDLNLALLTALGIEPAYGAFPDAGFLRNGAPSAGGIAEGAVVLLPGAGRRSKAWAPARFGALSRRLAADGLRSVVVWGPGEEPLARQVVDLSAPGTEVAPQTTLVELAGTLARCRAAVGGDTGPVHLAAALGTPTLAIHLQTDPRRNGPRGPRVNVVTGDLAGTENTFARAGDRRDVTEAEVHEALASLLNEGTRSSGG